MDLNDNFNYLIYLANNVLNLYPTFIVFFFILVGSIRGSFTGLFYSISVSSLLVLCRGINWVGAKKFGKREDPKTGVEMTGGGNIDCITWSNLFAGVPTMICTQSALSWFTFIYLVLPMFIQNVVINWRILVILSVFAMSNNIFRYYVKNCTQGAQSILLGGLIGLLVGAGSITVIWHINRQSLFNSEIVSNNAICSRPSRQSFKCEVWKGQELISTSIT